ncbi:MAG: DUF2752 domain-containing protein [Candidatus Limivivens sp.]|nr:DUF2752 domain-containing protein [Candidatus Limivivens sp.]
MEEKERKSVYCLCWGLAAFGILGAVLEKCGLFSLKGLLPPCLFHVITGGYCPGCGGTRAVEALLQGNLTGALKYHPLVPYLAVLFVWFLISNTVEYLSRGRFRIGMRFRKRYVWIGAVILAVSWIGKNVLYFLYQIPLEAY